MFIDFLFLEDYWSLRCIPSVFDDATELAFNRQAREKSDSRPRLRAKMCVFGRVLGPSGPDSGKRSRGINVQVKYLNLRTTTRRSLSKIRI